MGLLSLLTFETPITHQCDAWAFAGIADGYPMVYGEFLGVDSIQEREKSRTETRAVAWRPFITLAFLQVGADLGTYLDPFF